MEACPRICPESRNATSPEGKPLGTSTWATRVVELAVVALERATTLAVKLLAAPVTTTAEPFETLAAKTPLALKVAVMLCVPIPSDAVLNSQVPSALSELLPIGMVPS